MLMSFYWTMHSNVQASRTIIITGGNSGLGFETAKALARDPQNLVLLACRSAQKGAEAAGQIKAATGCPRVDVEVLDLASLSSVAAFCERVLATAELPLHAIICNAAMMEFSRETTTVDGIDTTFASNHLGHYLLTQTLLPAMSAKGRILMISSAGHDPAQKTDMPAPTLLKAIDVAKPSSYPSVDPEVRGRIRYVNSKLCNVLYTYALAEQLRHDARGISVNAFDPGGMSNTGLTADWPASKKFVVNKILPPLAPLFRLAGFDLRTTQVSGVALARLATDQSFEGQSGLYFSDKKALRSSEASYERSL